MCQSLSMTILIGFIIEELECLWFDLVKSVGKFSIKVQMTIGNFFDTLQEESTGPSTINQSINWIFFFKRR